MINSSYTMDVLALYSLAHYGKGVPLQPALSLETGTIGTGSWGQLDNTEIINKWSGPEKTLPLITLKASLEMMHSQCNSAFFDRDSSVVTDIMDDHPYWNHNEQTDPVSQVASTVAKSVSRGATASACHGMRRWMGRRGVAGGGGSGGDGNDDRYWWWRIRERLQKKQSAMIAAMAAFSTAAWANIHRYKNGGTSPLPLPLPHDPVSVTEATGEPEEPEEQEPVFLTEAEKIEVYDRLARTERMALFNKKHSEDGQEFEHRLRAELFRTGSIYGQMVKIYFPYTEAENINPQLLKEKALRIIEKIARLFEESDVIINFRLGRLLDFEGNELVNHYHPRGKKTSVTKSHESLNETEIRIMDSTNELEHHDDDNIRARHIRFRDQPSTHNRPFYGSLYFDRSEFGTNPWQYGRSFIVLKKNIKQSCVFIAGDTLRLREYEAYSMFQMKSLAVSSLRHPEVSQALIDKIVYRKQLSPSQAPFIEAQIYTRVLIPEMISELHITLHDGGRLVDDEDVDHEQLARVIRELKTKADQGTLSFELYIDGQRYPSLPPLWKQLLYSALRYFNGNH